MVVEELTQFVDRGCWMVEERRKELGHEPVDDFLFESLVTWEELLLQKTRDLTPTTPQGLQTIIELKLQIRELEEERRTLLGHMDQLSKIADVVKAFNKQRLSTWHDKLRQKDLIWENQKLKDQL